MTMWLATRLPSLDLRPRAALVLGAGPFALASLVAALSAGCAAGTSGVPGLPSEEFDRAYRAGLDIAAAERCGVPVDAGLVRYNLVEDSKRRGVTPEIAEKSGRAFDKTRAEYRLKLYRKPQFCVSEYDVSVSQLTLYQQGEFSR